MDLSKETRIIENVLLYIMEDRRSDYSRSDFAYPLRFLAEQTGLHRDVVRGLCRSLTDQGLAFYKSALWSEEGGPAGAGYGITDAGYARLQAALII